MVSMKVFNAQLRTFEIDQRGTALIELAVVLPVLLAISLGVFEFGNAIYGRHLIENGIRDGARFAAGLPHDDATAISEAKNIAVTGVTSGGSLRVSWWDPLNAVSANRKGTISVVYTALADNGNVYCGTVATPAYCRGRDTSGNIYVVTVSTDVAYPALGFLGYLGLGTITLHASHEERLFGVR